MGFLGEREGNKRNFNATKPLKNIHVNTYLNLRPQNSKFLSKHIVPMYICTYTHTCPCIYINMCRFVWMPPRWWLHSRVVILQHGRLTRLAATDDKWCEQNWVPYALNIYRYSNLIYLTFSMKCWEYLRW